MLSELMVTNVGGVREASLHFRGRFIVITGESGAGKSSLVRALELVSGKRAQSMCFPPPRGCCGKTPTG